MNLFFRPLIPIVLKQPVLNSTGNFENKGVALGDISFDLAVGKSFPSRIMLLGGIVGTAPAATDVSISLRQWLLGPEVFIAYVGNWGVVGVLLTQSWDIGGSNKSSTSITGGQYLYSVNLGNAWQLFSGPSFSYNHNSPDGSKFTFPLGIGVSKTISLGGVPLKIAVEDWYYLAKPDSFGPQNQVRLTLTPVVPLPW
jgi:hypothetical protein